MRDVCSATTALYKRPSWQKKVDEGKIDMGLLESFSQDDLDMSLRCAVDEQYGDGMREMVEMGADLARRFDGETLLHRAVRAGNLKTVLTLLELGADPLVQDDRGRTPRTTLTSWFFNRAMITVLKQWEKRQSVPQRAVYFSEDKKKSASLS